MSCPDWQALTAHRFMPEGREPAGWEEALAHLDGCDECRRRALAADPTLLFRAAASEPDAAADLDAMKVAVRTLRRAGRVERRRAGLRRYGSFAAALLLAVLALLAIGPEADPPGSAPVATAPESAESMRFGDRRVAPLDLATTPMVEAIDRPGARIYQLPEDDLSLVMIVDESLDV